MYDKGAGVRNRAMQPSSLPTLDVTWIDQKGGFSKGGLDCPGLNCAAYGERFPWLAVTRTLGGTENFITLFKFQNEIQDSLIFKNGMYKNPTSRTIE